MADEQFDPWGTDNSSGFLQNYAGDIEDSWFGTNPNVNEGQTLLLHLKTVGIQPTDPDEETEQEELVQTYSCGSGWRTEDGGKTATHPAGARRLFHASSLYGKIIDSVKGELAGYGDNAKTPDGNPVKVDLTSLMDVIRERGNPMEAEVWKGLRLRFEEVHFDYGINRKTQEAMKSNRAMPVEFLGEVGKPAAKAKGASKVTDAAEKAKAKAAKAIADKKAARDGGGDAGEGEGNPAEKALMAIDVGDDVRVGVLNCLTNVETHAEFVDACLEVDGVAENDLLLEAIVNDGDDGLWAISHPSE